MKSTVSLTLLLCLLALLPCSLLRAEESRRGIPYKPDPPFEIDGNLADWTNVPGKTEISEAGQVIFGKGAWKSPEDFSGVVMAGWRHEHLYLAAEVIDDNLSQTQSGGNIWKGDHVEIFLDANPELEPERNTIGEGQFQIGFSPGNFLDTGDAFTDRAPEAYCFNPRGKDTSGVVVASRQTDNGWDLEAAVPWSFLEVDQPQKGTELRIEIAISDTDTSEPRQESMMTTSSETWGLSRSRFGEAALAGSDGVPPPVVRGIPVFENLELGQGEKTRLEFELPPVPEGKEAVLTLQARMHTQKVAGHTPALRLSLNDASLTPDRLRGKPLRVKSRSGKVYSMAAGDRLTTFYSPDFTSPDRHSHYALLGGVKACDFELEVTDLVEEGKNILTVSNAAAATVDNPLIAENGKLVFRSPPPPPKEKSGPPTGPLPVIEPATQQEAEFLLRALDNSQIEVEFGGEPYVVQSRFSMPEPGWATGSNPFFNHKRRIEKRPEAVVVFDTFTNLTDENLGIMQRHQVPLGDGLDRIWLGGLEQPKGGGSNAESSNPTTYGAIKKGGIGLLPLSDAFRTHVTNYAVKGEIGIADNNLVIPPNSTYTAEWAVVPTKQTDYWAFINAVRRLVNANFTIPGAFAFIHARSSTRQWSDEQVTDFLRFKDAYYACTSIVEPRYKGSYTHGTAFQHVTHDNYREGIERWRKLFPEAEYLVYYHCFIDPTDDSPEKFADARTLRPDGTQIDYGKEAMRLFFPTEDNAYGVEVAKNVDIIFDEIGADGVYWDEHAYSRAAYHFGEPWDGVSGDIDPKTMKVSRLKSSVSLLSDTWRVAVAKRILERGPLVGNGSPRTRAMAALQFPCFHETGSITNCVKSHLYSPIALGDHLTERSEEDAYQTMLAALDYGCVYHWYGQLNVIPTHPHLTRYMYPITPVEIHEGYIIGEERIVTNRSGLFGWGDDSVHEVHVFDDAGREAESFSAHLLRKDGKTYTELRIGEDWSAAIVRSKIAAEKTGN